MQHHVKDASFHKKKGWLMKCAKDSGKNWRKRYFVLTNNTLNYYVSDKDLRKPKGNVLIVSDARLRPENAIATQDHDQKFYGFRLTTPFESILFLTVSETDRAAWVHAIQDSIDRAHQSLRGYMLRRTAALGFGERTTRKFWVLHKDTLTYHKDHENTRFDEFAYTITDATDIEPDDDKWKIKINDDTGKRIVTIQFEERTARDYPLWRDALLNIRNKSELEEKQYQEHLGEVMTDAVEVKDMNVLGEDGGWRRSSIAFTKEEVIVQETGEDGSTQATFFKLTPSSAIKQLDEQEAGTPHAFQITTATETIRLTAKDETQLTQCVEAMETLTQPTAPVDIDNVLHRATIKKIMAKDAIYRVIIIEKKALGMVIKPIEEWAIIKDYDGYSALQNGIAAGSAFHAINGQDCMFLDFSDTTSTLKEAFESPEPMTLEFRAPPSKSGKLFKKSASKKNGKSVWTERFFELQAGKLHIHPVESENSIISIPIRDAAVSLCPYSEYLKEFCFCVDIGAVHLVLQARDVDDMMEWASDIKYAISIASGGVYIMEQYELQQAMDQKFEECVCALPIEEMSEETQHCVIEVGGAVKSRDVESLEKALNDAYLNEWIKENATEFLEAATSTLNALFEDEHSYFNEMQALAVVCQPDEEQARIMEEQATLSQMASFIDAGVGDSDDEEEVSVRLSVHPTRSSFIGEEILTEEQEEALASAASKAEYEHLQQLQAQEEPDPDEVGVCASEEELCAIFGFYKKKSEEGKGDFINVMNFCTIWRMITGHKGDLMEEMQVFNSFDKQQSGFLEVDEFTSGFFTHATKTGSNKLLIRLHSLVDGGSVMF